MYHDVIHGPEQGILFEKDQVNAMNRKYQYVHITLKEFIIIETQITTKKIIFRKLFSVKVERKKSAAAIIIATT